MHAGAKVFLFTIPGFIGYFASLGLPAALAYFVLALETFGGFSLILGIYAPWVAVPLAIELIGAIVLVHGANGWNATNKGGGWEFPALWIVALIALFLIGDGPFTLRSTRATPIK
jgi:putative oxidoreductase